MNTISRRNFSAAAIGAALGAGGTLTPAWAASPALRDLGAVRGLAGKVVLVDFWTYSCVNCVNTLPHVVRWYDKYKDQGFVVVGIHTPEFAFEKSTANVQAALKRFDIRYPVAQDNSFATWRAYNNQYWPAFYLVDKTGRVRRTHFGEGQYAEMDAAIQALLAQPAG